MARLVSIGSALLGLYPGFCSLERQAAGGQALGGKMPSDDSVEPWFMAVQLVLYSKPGCHLCEGLAEKLAALSHLAFDLETRDITTQADWFEAYQYSIPVLCRVIETPEGTTEEPLPRLSPRAPVSQVERLIQTCLTADTAE